MSDFTSDLITLTDRDIKQTDFKGLVHYKFGCIWEEINYLKSFVVSDNKNEGVMDRVCGLRLGPNFVVRLGSENNFHLLLTIEKKHAFEAFNNKYTVAIQILRLRLMYKSKNWNTR